MNLSQESSLNDLSAEIMSHPRVKRFARRHGKKKSRWLPRFWPGNVEPMCISEAMVLDILQAEQASRQRFDCDAIHPEECGRQIAGEIQSAGGMHAMANTYGVSVPFMVSLAQLVISLLRWLQDRKANER